MNRGWNHGRQTPPPDTPAGLTVEGQPVLGEQAEESTPAGERIPGALYWNSALVY
jgi:hypothetical protein